MAILHTRDDGFYGSNETEADLAAGRRASLAEPVSRWMQLAGAATSLALICGVLVWGYKLAVRDVTGVPIIRAMQGPSRIAPEDPGGDLARHTGLAVNEVAGTGLAAPGPERVLLAPDPERLDEGDGPMRDLRPMPKVTTTATGLPEVMPASMPVPNLPLSAAGTGTPEATPDDDAASAEADGSAPVETPDAVAAATASPDAIPASVPGVNHSPRPLARPNDDMIAAAVEQAVVASLSGGTAKPASLDIEADSLPADARVAQLGAYDTPEIARAEWDKVAQRFGPLMDGKSRIIQKATSGGRDFYRLRVAGFDTVEAARQFCAALVAENANCIPTLAR